MGCLNVCRTDISAHHSHKRSRSVDNRLCGQPLVEVKHPEPMNKDGNPPKRNRKCVADFLEHCEPSQDWVPWGSHIATSRSKDLRTDRLMSGHPFGHGSASRPQPTPDSTGCPQKLVLHIWSISLLISSPLSACPQGAGVGLVQRDYLEEFPL